MFLERMQRGGKSSTGLVPPTALVKGTYEPDHLPQTFSLQGLGKWAVEAVGLDMPGKGSVLASPYMRFGAFIALYNIRLKELREERKSWQPAETRLEKTLKMLPPIDPAKLRPSAESLKQLKGDI